MKQQELFTGAQLKEAGINLVATNNTVWIALVHLRLVMLSHQKPTFTAEDLRKRCAEDGLPPPLHPNAWGAVFNRAAKLKLIHRVGHAKNHIASAHARIVGIWERNQ